MKSGISIRKGRSGFTLLEVVFASVVLALAVTTSITAVSQCMKLMDVARGLTYASQILQDQVEDLRCTPWSTVITWPTSTDISLDQVQAASSFVAGHEYTCRRSVSSVTGKSLLVKVTYIVTWNGMDGRSYSRTVSSYYFSTGLYSYVAS